MITSQLRPPINIDRNLPDQPSMVVAFAFTERAVDEMLVKRDLLPLTDDMHKYEKSYFKGPVRLLVSPMGIPPLKLVLLDRRFITSFRSNKIFKSLSKEVQERLITTGASILPCGKDEEAIYKAFSNARRYYPHCEDCTE